MVRHSLLKQDRKSIQGSRKLLKLKKSLSGAPTKSGKISHSYTQKIAQEMI
jgi:hypothetical protein